MPATTASWALAPPCAGWATIAEFGAYFLNYHSRTPNLSMQNANAADITAALTTLAAPWPSRSWLAAAATSWSTPRISAFMV